MTPLEAAVLFHETYERLAPSFGYETRQDTKTFDHESKNGKLMIAVCGEVISRLTPLPPEASFRHSSDMTQEQLIATSGRTERELRDLAAMCGKGFESLKRNSILAADVIGALKFSHDKQASQLKNLGVGQRIWPLETSENKKGVVTPIDEVKDNGHNHRS